MNQPAQVMLLPQSSYQLDELDEKLELILTHFQASLPKTKSKVLLKPNLVKSSKRHLARQTDCEFMRALILCCKKRNWDTTVGDSPAIGSARLVATPSGLTKVSVNTRGPFSYTKKEISTTN